MARCKICVLLLILSVSAVCLAQSKTTDTTKSDPIAYLNRALDEMQARALRRATVDWSRVRAEALRRAAHAETTVDTYDAIRFALASLGDHHSSLHLTPALENLELQRKAQHPSGQGNEEVQGSLGPFVGRYGPEGRLETFNSKTFALVVVTKCFPESDRQFVAYETKLQKIVADLIGLIRQDGLWTCEATWAAICGQCSRVSGQCLAKAMISVSPSTRPLGLALSRRCLRGGRRQR